MIWFLFPFNTRLIFNLVLIWRGDLGPHLPCPGKTFVLLRGPYIFFQIWTRVDGMPGKCLNLCTISLALIFNFKKSTFNPKTLLNLRSCPSLFYYIFWGEGFWAVFGGAGCILPESWGPRLSDVLCSLRRAGITSTILAVPGDSRTRFSGDRRPCCARDEPGIGAPAFWAVSIAIHLK